MGKRFIPTCVGNWVDETWARAGNAVHPHMRGELGGDIELDRRIPGSSPHAWGTAPYIVGILGAKRFIPTCVGNWPANRDTPNSPPVHPHMRGELILMNCRQTLTNGSSPHAWGTAVTAENEPPEFRFIPTCVGNCQRPPLSRWGISVHPHMRGELLCLSMARFFACGSSPHAWGTDIFQRLALAPKRFIPTCVGNCRRCRTTRFFRAVHPHMRGELFRFRAFRGSTVGSSPHAWGTDRVTSVEQPMKRFIPTCVGNCWRYSVAVAQHAVHPHMRGELLDGTAL